MMGKSDNAWFLGIDLGTGSCKSIIITAGGRLLGFGTGEYAAQGGNPNGEQDPQQLLQALIRSVRNAIKGADVDPAACQALSIGGAFHSLIAMDASHTPLTAVLTWVDQRAGKQAREVREMKAADSIYQRTGCPVHGMYPLYKILWLRREHPQIFDQTVRFISAKEYVIHRLTGEYLVDFGIGAGTSLLNTHALEWDSQSLDLAGIHSGQLSPLADPRQVLKGMDAEIAAQMGLPLKTPIVLGSADAVNSSLGAGAVLPGQATLMIGTSGAFRVIAPRPILDAQARSWCYAIDRNHWLVGGAINNGGLALTWLRDALNTMINLQGGQIQFSFDELMASASHIAPGAQGLICLPFFAGERSPYWNMNARGVFLGLTLEHDARHMVRALLEGVAFRLRSIHEVFSDLGLDVKQVRASGGFTHSDLWPQIVADVLGHDLAIPANGETSSLGAAFWAMFGSGAIERFEDLQSLVEITRTYESQPQTKQVYDSLYRIYLDLYFQLGKTFEQISRI